ncbi:MAG: DMT family transporter [Candidatus Riflebacteria bacterium]|nr:DMT family transporter [Candidatus Riflebacteria bacterium]
MKANLLLLLISAIWGFAFVFQRMGMDNIGPFFFNATRFALGGFCVWSFSQFQKKLVQTDNQQSEKYTAKLLWIGGIVGGLALFSGSSFQQTGMVYTTPGKAGFITSLYVALVPFLGIFLGQKLTAWQIIGAALAMVGMFLLTIKSGADFTLQNFYPQWGDLLVLIGTLFWAIHVQIVDYYSKKIQPLVFAQFQSFVCSGLSLIAALAFEKNTFFGFCSALIPVMYCGIVSVGIAYTLQVVAQEKANPTHAAIIMGLEGAFAAVGGAIFLSEKFTSIAIAGCILMLIGTIVSQIKFKHET